ncbi:hypothetical protein [Anaerotignum sp.]|uniref:hypothetical protein n=1 Tax=Anaerotignum sp. TaxID=2039241 RepID=UPI00271534D7|nr:hypothetical protein [Anaerotignum sp.]
MQNPNAKYIKMPNGYFYLFYRENNTLFLQAHANTGWGTPQILAKRTAFSFSICQFKELCYVLYSTIDGTLFLAFSKDFTNWDHRSLMFGTPNSGKSKYFMVPTEDAFHVFYHLPTESTGIETLTYNVFRNGQWESPCQIDRFMPLGKTSFFARRLSKDHIILYYRTSRNIWSAREMLLSPYTMGNLTPMIQTSLNYVDISIVNDAERIHFLYIVRSLFRMQVVYQYKQTSAISTPRVLWEDVNCDNCLAFLENQRLTLMWTVNGQPLRCISENNGATFGVVERYTGNFPAQCSKCELLGADGAELNATEAYGDKSRNFAPYPILSKTLTLANSEAMPLKNKKQQPPYSEKEKRGEPPYFEKTNESQNSYFDKENQPQNPYFDKPNQYQNSYSEKTNQPQKPYFDKPNQYQNSYSEKMNQPRNPYFDKPNQYQNSYSEKTNQPQNSYFDKPNQYQNSYSEKMNQYQNSHFENVEQFQPFSTQQSKQTQLQQYTKEKPVHTSNPLQDVHKKRVEELSALLAQRSDEITSINARWKAHVSQLEGELTTLQMEIQELKKTQSKQQPEEQQTAVTQIPQPQSLNQEHNKIQVEETISIQAPENQIVEAIQSPPQLDGNIENAE